MFEIFVRHPYFTEETVQKEQGIIGQEIDMYKDLPDWVCLFNMLGGMFHNHPVKIDIAGTVESISQIDKSVLYNCYNTYYNPANMAICVVGNVEPELVFDIVEKTVQSRENGRVISVYPDEPKEVLQKYGWGKSKELGDGVFKQIVKVSEAINTFDAVLRNTTADSDYWAMNAHEQD